MTIAALPAAGQWLNSPTKGIARTRDGKPDLAAPAPRTPDGKPDISAILESGQPNLHLEFQLTVDDPKAYTKPWTVTLPPMQFDGDNELLEYVCNENEKDRVHYRQ